MKQNLLLVSTLASAIALGGCASRDTISIGFEPGSCVFSETGESGPDWLCAPDNMFPQGYWYQLGRSPGAIQDPNLRHTVAVQNARIELARRASSKVEETFKQLMTTSGIKRATEEEISRDVLSTVTTEVQLPPTFKEAEQYDSEGNLYVLLKVDEAALIASIESKQQQLLREFNARLKALEHTPARQGDEALVKAQPNGQNSNPALKHN